MDEKRVQWAAEDLIKNRPALSRWHPIAGAVSLDVEVLVSGVRRVRTGPQNGCLTIVASMLLFAFVVFRPVASDQIAAGALAPAE